MRTAPPVQCEAIIEGGRCPNPATRHKWYWAVCEEHRKRPAYRLEARVRPDGKIETAPKSEVEAFAVRAVAKAAAERKSARR